MLLASSCEGNLHFRTTLFEVHLERHDCEWLGLSLDPPLVDLVTVDEEFAFTVRIVTTESNGVTPRWNVGAEEPQLPVINPGVTFGDLRLTLAKGLHFTAGEYQTTLQGVHDFIIVASTSIRGDHPVTRRAGSRVGATLLNLFGSCHESSVVTSADRTSGR